LRRELAPAVGEQLARAILTARQIQESEIREQRARVAELRERLSRSATMHSTKIATTRYGPASTQSRDDIACASVTINQHMPPMMSIAAAKEASRLFADG